MLDTNILVRANERSHGSARAVLTALIDQGHTLLVSGEMLVELAGVLRYPRLQALYSLTEEQIYNYVQYLREVSVPVAVDRQLAVPIRDPKDIAVLHCCSSDSRYWGSRHHLYAGC